ncbi:MAG TPA: two-component sensor histidine kinase [Bacteroidetes bacterium]|nr:two-component sensor histidine kinase [Bacteroidota bacterium]
MYSIRTKLLLYYLGLFFLFLLIVGIFQYNREKDYSKGKLINTLDTYTEITNNFIQQNNIIKNNNFKLLDSLKSFIPLQNSRLTVIDSTGKVLYDSYVIDYKNLENHSGRPEIIEAKNNSTGNSIRKSSSTGLEYFYFAKKYDNLFIRAAKIYDVSVAGFLKVNKLLFYFLFLLFTMILVLIWFGSSRFSYSISQLKDFTINAAQNKVIDYSFNFPNDEIGLIGKKITDIYSDLKKTEKELKLEKEKLYRHLNVLKEGIAVFSPNKKKLLSNRNFFKYINLISNDKIIEGNEFLNSETFREINQFIEKNLNDNIEIEQNKVIEHSFNIKKDNKYFKLKVIFFYDKSFEIIITDDTKRVKNKLIKSQLTSNIAHELKTPVSAIHAYIETILKNDKLKKDKRNYFLEKSFIQTERLAELINDIATIDKLEEADDYFDLEKINIYNIVEEIKNETSFRRHQKNINFKNKIKKDQFIIGNKELLFSIFQNLVENTINYAGDNIEIIISQYKEDKEYIFISYMDTGKGIPEEHLNRIFERFYRIDTGRTRKSGGTGLGLSIVKNAILFHKGDITAKNIKGGFEFLFTLKKVL